MIKQWISQGVLSTFTQTRVLYELGADGPSFSVMNKMKRWCSLKPLNELSPMDPRSYLLLTGIGAAHFFKKDFEECVRWTERALERNRDRRNRFASMRRL